MHLIDPITENEYIEQSLEIFLKELLALRTEKENPLKNGLMVRFKVYCLS